MFKPTLTGSFKSLLSGAAANVMSIMSTLGNFSATKVEGTSVKTKRLANSRSELEGREDAQKYLDKRRIVPNVASNVKKLGKAGKIAKGPLVEPNAEKDQTILNRHVHPRRNRPEVATPKSKPKKAS